MFALAYWGQPIAHFGSLSSTCLHCLSASSYQNECSSATPRSNGFCTLAEQEVGNETVPSFSVEVKCWCSSSALSGMSDTRRTKRTARVTSFIGFATRILLSRCAVSRKALVSPDTTDQFSPP